MLSAIKPIRVAGRGYDSVILRDSPVSYWPLDETNGTTALDALGANNGTYAGDFTLNQKPSPLSRHNRGYASFGGTTSNVAITYSSSMKFGTGAFSMITSRT